jgi:hypothetical protein
MDDKNREETNLQPSRTLTDDQIVTEKKVPRRSFLSTSGIFLAGGAAAIVSGVRSKAASPDDTPRHDPDKPADKKHDDRDRNDRKRDDRDRDKRPDDRDKKPHDQSRL